MGFINQIRDFFDSHMLIFNLLALLIIYFLISKVYEKFLDKIKNSESFRRKVIIYEVLECIFIFIIYSILKMTLTNGAMPNLKDFAFMILVSLCLDRARIKEEKAQNHGKTI